ncbi:hypothetical protein H9660_05360 [Clostridium sp. Sa3CUN1]|uniref:Phage protein n=1 Tax=Clostridium gallinarum TaxID=2762246 RepID=A0ABR8Q2B2_9CLOT|nr:hypothetical protein [Clostridium gallinarum]MBD7914566.1 hypothetical protein [Clostridium gallinarum]
MQKIFINKETNMVEQILKIESENELPDNYFPTCYAALDIENNINGYNLRYDLETKEFEVVDGIPAKDEIIIEKVPGIEDYNDLKKENEELKNRLDKLENLITRSISEVKIDGK